MARQPSEPANIVRDGYDRIAERYAAWRPDGNRVKAKYIASVRSLVPRGARVLDLGCGTGDQVTQQLAQHFDVVGVDISGRSVQIAARTVLDAHFVIGDIASVSFRARSFAAVTAFFSLIHVPRNDHARVLASVARWLEPGGVFVATMGAGPAWEGTDDFLGTPMYWSNWDRATNLHLVHDAGFEILSVADETEDEDGTPVTHLWVVARHP
jgi:ubiquinone/menaquinone biosynthesis C-methylase UbiE